MYSIGCITNTVTSVAKYVEDLCSEMHGCNQNKNTAMRMSKMNQSILSIGLFILHFKNNNKKITAQTKSKQKTNKQKLHL